MTYHKMIFSISFIILMFMSLFGVPSQVASTNSSYYFPWYNNVDLDTQLRFGNIGTIDTNITVKIAGIVRGVYLTHPNQTQKLSYLGVNDGPVNIYSSGAPIVASEREIYAINGVNTSFSELAGTPIDISSTSVATPTSNPSVSCSGGTGMAYYQMCPGQVDSLVSHNFTSTWDNVSMEMSNFILSGTPLYFTHSFRIDTQYWGGASVLTINRHGAGQGITDMRSWCITSVGLQDCLGEVSNAYGCATQPEIILVGESAPVGTMVYGSGSFWTYDQVITSNDCSHATILYTMHGQWRSKLIAKYPTYVFGGVTYIDVVIMALQEMVVESGLSGTDGDYWFIYSRNLGMVVNCAGTITTGITIAGGCYQMVLP